MSTVACLSIFLHTFAQKNTRGVSDTIRTQIALNLLSCTESLAYVDFTCADFIFAPVLNIIEISSLYFFLFLMNPTFFQLFWLFDIQHNFCKKHVWVQWHDTHTKRTEPGPKLSLVLLALFKTFERYLVHKFITFASHDFLTFNTFF